MNLAFVQQMLQKASRKNVRKSAIYRIAFQQAVWRHWKELQKPPQPELADPYHSYRPPLRVRSLAREKAAREYERYCQKMGWA